MTTLTRSKPFAEIKPLPDIMSRVLEDRAWASRSYQQAVVRLLALDMYAAADEVVVRAALPGFPEKDLEMNVDHGTLSIRARRSENGNQSGNGEAESHR